MILFTTSQILNLPEKQVQFIFNIGFGYGKKTDLEFDKNPLQVVPPSNTYNIDSFIDVNKKKNKGFTPRYSREVKV